MYNICTYVCTQKIVREEYFLKRNPSLRNRHKGARIYEFFNNHLSTALFL